MNPYPGRPREFTHKKREELINHIAQGASVEEAARIVGISLRTVQREAKHNEFFDHDLHLALHHSPVDPEHLVKRAARTHWRAAAWLLERSDPDRYAKRPPNSCSPDKLQDIMAFLIETALQATQPDQREIVYRRMQEAADRAFDALMPDQHESRRWTNGLSTLPMPLSSHEFAKSVGDPDHDRKRHERVLANNPALRLRHLLQAQTPPAAGAAGPVGELAPPPKVPQWFPPSGKRQDSDDMDAERCYLTPEEEDAYADALDARAEAREAARAEARAEKEAAARKKSERRKSLLGQHEESVGDRLRKAFPLTAPRPSVPTVAPRAVESPPVEKPATPAAADPAPPTPPDGGIIAPEMSAATEPDATKGPPTSEGDPAPREKHPFYTLLAQIRARRQQPPSARAG